MANQIKTNNSPESDNPRRIVHLGLGAFFRAHGAIYVQQAVLESGENWSITGISLNSPSAREKLRPGGFTYNVMLKHDTKSSFEHITIIDRVIYAGDEYDDVIASLTADETRIVTLTITEKGYCRVASSGNLDLSHPGIQHDLVSSRPTTAPGLIVRALSLRRAKGMPAFTVLSCDNLVSNGRLTQSIVQQFAALKEPGLETWITRYGRFPSSMVDRIVPATSESDRDEFRKLTGKSDAGLVVAEPFRQWVIEDDFVDQIRPDWAKVGVQMVDDVAPFETMKLRMLNGTHSTLAWLGGLLGMETIYDSVSDPDLSRFVHSIWRNEIIPIIAAPAGTDLHQYAATLFVRYANPNIRHRLVQIATDSSQKLPQRILVSIEDNFAGGRICPGLCLSVVAFLKYCAGKGEMGQDLGVNDPLALPLIRAMESARTLEDKVGAALEIDSIFQRSLASNEKFRADLGGIWRLANKSGVRSAIQAITNGWVP